MTAEQPERAKPSETGQEYRRFEELARKLVAVPKDAIKRAEKKRKARKAS